MPARYVGVMQGRRGWRVRGVRMYVWTLLLLAFAGAGRQGVTYGQGYEFRIKTTGLGPEAIVLSEARDGRWVAVDTVWQADDGLYHPYVERFTPGLYTLTFGHQPAFPLLLSRPTNDLLVQLRGTGSGLAVEVSPDGSTRTFAHSYQEGDTCAALRYLEGLGKHMLSPQDSLNPQLSSAASARCRRHNVYLTQAIAGSDDALLKALLSLLATPARDALASWWPADLLREPSVAPSRLLKDHLEAYLQAQIEPTATRTEQDSLFLEAVSALLALDMLPPLHDKLQHYATYFFQEIGALELATYVRDYAAAQGHNARMGSLGKQLTLDMRAARSMDVDGRSRPILNRKKPLTLIVVYSIWCPHCMALLPEVAAWYGEDVQRVLHITSISSDGTDYGTLQFIRNLGFPWQSCAEAGGESPLLKSLRFESTPYLLLFNREGHFVEQPLGFTQLKARIAHSL